MSSTAYRKMAAEVVAKYGQYMPNARAIANGKPYTVRFEGRSYFAKDTDDLAEQVAAAMRSNAAKQREYMKRRCKEM